MTRQSPKHRLGRAAQSLSRKAKLAILGSAAALTVGGLAMSASASSTIATFSSPTQTGYSVVGGHIRFASETVTLPTAAEADARANVASSYDYQVALLSSGFGPAGVELKSSDGVHWTADGTDGCARATPAGWQSQGSDLVAGDQVQLSVYYDQWNGILHCVVSDPHSDANSFGNVVRGLAGTLFYSARFWDAFPATAASGGTWAQPSKATLLDTFTNVAVTSYNGTHGGLTGIPWTEAHPWNYNSNDTTPVTLASPNIATGVNNAYGVYATAAAAAAG